MATRARFWLRHAAAAAATLALAVPVWAAIDLSLRRFYQADEFVFVRCAWLVGSGSVPYRDFFDHHTPLFYTLLAPVMALSGEGVGGLVAGRLFALALLMLVGLMVWVMASSMGGRAGAWLAVFLLATCHGFMARGIEIRPDLLATLAFVGVGALLLTTRRDAVWRAAVAGALVAAAVLSTQKAVYYVWGMPLLALWDLLRRPRAGGRLVGGPPWAFFAGAGAVAGALFAALGLTGALPAFWEQNVVLALEWQATDRSFPAATLLLPALGASPHWVLGVVGGTAVIAARRGLRVRLDGRQWAVYGALALPGLLSLALNPIPWPYNFLPVFAILAPLAAWLPPWLEATAGAWLRNLAAAALVLLAVVSYGPRLAVEAERGNEGQRRELTALLTATRGDEPVFDANGGYLFRPAAYRYWYHSSAMRGFMMDQFARDIVPAILESGAPAWIVDWRFYELPDNVRRFLQWSYQRYTGAVYLWGGAYRAEGGTEEIETFSFRAVRAGDYFLQTLDDGAGSASVRIDGKAVEPRRPFRLTAAEHEIEVETGGPPFEFFVLWLPANGDLWRPLPGRPPPYYPWHPADPRGWLATR